MSHFRALAAMAALLLTSGCASNQTTTGDVVGGPGLGGTYGDANTHPADINSESPSVSQTLESSSAPGSVTRDIWWIHGPGTAEFNEVNRPSSLRDVAAASNRMILGRVSAVVDGNAYPEMKSTFSSTIITIKPIEAVGSLSPPTSTLELPRSAIYSIDDVRSSITNATYLFFLQAPPKGFPQYGGSFVCTSPSLCVLGDNQTGLYSAMVNDAFPDLEDAREFTSLSSAYSSLDELVK